MVVACLSERWAGLGNSNNCYVSFDWVSTGVALAIVISVRTNPSCLFSLLNTHPHVAPKRNASFHSPNTRFLLVSEVRREGAEELC